MRLPLARFVPKGRFMRRMAVLSGGTLLGQLILVASSPLLTRLFDPHAFGLFAIFNSLNAIAGMVMALRYEFAIPLCRTQREAAAMAAVCLVTTTALSLLSIVAVWAFGPWLAARTGTPALAAWLWLMPPSLFLYGLSLPLDYWSIRDGTIRSNAATRLTQSLGQIAPQLGLGLAGMTGGGGLIIGYCTGFVVRAAHFLHLLPRRHLLRLRRVRAAEIWARAREHWRYPVFTTTSSLCTSITQLLPAVLLAALYGPAVAGLFGLGQRIMDLPVRLLSQATSQVFLGEAARREGAGLYRLFRRTALGFFLVGLAGMAPVLLAGPFLFALVFGEPWRMAGTMMQYLVPLQLARFVVLPISQTLNLVRRQDLHLVSAAINLLALVASFTLSWRLRLDPLPTVLIYSIGSSFSYVLYFLFAARATRAGNGPAPASETAPAGAGE